MKKRFYLFTVLSVSLVLFNACQSDVDWTSINAARNHFETTAPSLSLPILDVHYTKSAESEKVLQSAYPVWNEALVSEIDGHSFVEVPLSGSYKVIGSIVTMGNGEYAFHRATAKSYLVIDYAEPSPKMYVETFLQKGTKCTMTAYSNRKRVIGFEIISDLNGHVYQNTGYNAGTVRSMDTEHPAICTLYDGRADYFDCQMAYAAAGVRTKVGCVGWVELFVCPQCYHEFWKSVDGYWECPSCGYPNYPHCPVCGRTLGACGCQNPPGTCPPCGQPESYCVGGCGNKGEHCPCDVGPENH